MLRKSYSYEESLIGEVEWEEGGTLYPYTIIK